MRVLRWRVIYRRRRRKPSAARKKVFEENKAKALRMAIARVNHFNQLYGFAVGKVSIKNQSTRWGSCSKKGNLNFNYRLVYLPSELMDYLVVHELCHLGQFNHSKAFWDLVAKSIPDYVDLRRELRRQAIDPVSG